MVSIFSVSLLNLLTDYEDMRVISDRLSVIGDRRFGIFQLILDTDHSAKPN